MHGLKARCCPNDLCRCHASGTAKQVGMQLPASNTSSEEQKRTSAKICRILPACTSLCTHENNKPCVRKFISDVCWREHSQAGCKQHSASLLKPCRPPTPRIEPAMEHQHKHYQVCLCNGSRPAASCITALCRASVSPHMLPGISVMVKHSSRSSTSGGLSALALFRAAAMVLLFQHCPSSSFAQNSLIICTLLKALSLFVTSSP